MPAVRDDFGQAVVGPFGIPALVPAGVTTVSRRCPPGAVLGKDDLCYMKGSIPAKYRKWPPARKPPISAKDFATLRVSNRVRDKSKKIAGMAGFTCKKR
jgi:hypothetical protein